MHTGISLLSIFFLSKEFRKLLCFHLFKKLVLSDEGVITLVIFQWYSTKKLYCCGLNVQIYVSTVDLDPEHHNEYLWKT